MGKSLFLPPQAGFHLPHILLSTLSTCYVPGCVVDAGYTAVSGQQASGPWWGWWVHFWGCLFRWRDIVSAGHDAGFQGHPLCIGHVWCHCSYYGTFGKIKTSKEILPFQSPFTFWCISSSFFAFCLSLGVISLCTWYYFLSLLSFCALPHVTTSTLHHQTFSGFITRHGGSGSHGPGGILATYWVFDRGQVALCASVSLFPKIVHTF